MSDFLTFTPNMNLPEPTPGQSPGQQYAIDQNAAFTIIDTHDHSAGKGVPVTPAGINVSSDLAFLQNNATQLRSARFFPQLTPLSGAADLGCLYESGVDLYYNDGLGNQVRITQSGGVAGSPGSIAGLTSPASATYVAGTSTFVWQSAANTPANMDFASAVLRNLVANSKGLTLQPPAAMAANYTITLPSLPPGQQIMTLDNSGNMSAPYTVDNSTIAITANVIGVKALGITAAQIANATITGTQIANNVNLPGTQVQANSKNLIVQGANTGTNMKIIRGQVALNGASAPVVGEGWTCTSHTTGSYVISFTTAFASTPVVVVTAGQSDYVANVTSISTTAFRINTFSGASQLDSDTNFIAIGPA